MVSKHDFICIYPVWGLQGWFLLLYFLGWFFKIILEKFGFCIFVAVLCSLVSYSLWPHGLWPARLPCSWNFPSKYTGVGCHFLLQGIFLTQGLNPSLLRLLHLAVRFFYPWATWEALISLLLFLISPLSIPSPLSSTMLHVLVVYCISLVLLFTLFSLWVSGCFLSSCFLSLFSLDVSSLILKLLQISYSLSSRN